MGVIRLTRSWDTKPTLGTALALGNPLLVGLKACFPFNELSGGNVTDRAIGGTGNSTNTVPWNANGLAGAGTASGRKVNTSVSWGSGEKYTIAFGIQKSTLGASVANGGVFRDNGSSGGYGWWVNDGNGAGTGKLWGRHNTSNVLTTATGPAVTDGKRHDVAVTWDGSNVQLYLDGFAFGAALSTGTSPGTVSTLWIGQQSGEEFLGDIFYWYGWGRALNTTEVFSLAQNPWQLFRPARGDARFTSSSSPSDATGAVSLGAISTSGSSSPDQLAGGVAPHVDARAYGQIGHPGPARAGFSRFWHRVQVATTYRSGIDPSVGAGAVTLGSATATGSSAFASSGSGAVTLGSSVVTASPEFAVSGTSAVSLGATSASGSASFAVIVTSGAVPRVEARAYGQIGHPGPAIAGFSRFWHRAHIAASYGRYPAASGSGAISLGATATAGTSGVTLSGSGAVTLGAQTTAGSATYTPVVIGSVLPRIGARPYGQIGHPGPARAGMSRFWHRVQVATTYSRGIGSSAGTGAIALGSTSVSGAGSSANGTGAIALGSTSASGIGSWAALGGGVRSLIGGRAQGQIGIAGPAPIGFSRFKNRRQVATTYSVHPNVLIGAGSILLGSSTTTSSASSASVGSGAVNMGAMAVAAVTKFTTNATGAITIGAKAAAGTATTAFAGQGSVAFASMTQTGLGSFGLSARSPGGVNSLIGARSQGQVGRPTPAPVGFSRFWQRQRPATSYGTAPFITVVNGSGAVSLGFQTASGAASLSTTSSGSPALSGVATAGTGRLTASATGSITLGQIVVAGAGIASGYTVATGSITLASITVTATPAFTDNATGAITLGAISATGVVKNVYSSGAVTLGSLTVAGTGSMTASAFGTVVLAGLSVENVEDFTASASGATTLAPIAASGISQDRTASGSITLDPMTAAGVSVDYRSTGAVTLGGISPVGSGSLADSATGAVTLGSLIAVGVGSSIPVGEIIAFGTVTLSPLGVSGSGSLATESSGAVSLESLVVAAAPLFTVGGTGTLDFGPITTAGQGVMQAAGDIALDPIAISGTAGFEAACSGTITLSMASASGVAHFGSPSAGDIALDLIQPAGTATSIGGIGFLFSRFDPDLANLISIELHDPDLAEVNADAGSMLLLNAHDLDMAEVDPDLADLMWFTTHDPGAAEVDPDIATLITL